MELTDVDNDTRGWIMCIVSGLACITGATIIYIDVLVRLLPSQKSFRIEESNGFLACSLSLSFGVMMFSALYNMLPASKRYLLKAGYADEIAGFGMMGFFVAGFIGIQVLSRLLHRLMPSHVVDCDHSHDDISEHGGGGSRRHSMASRALSKGRSPARQEPVKAVTFTEQNGLATESTPLLPTQLELEGNGRPETHDQSGTAPIHHNHIHSHNHSHNHNHNHNHSHSNLARGRTLSTTRTSRRPSIQQVRNRVMSFVKDTKTNCDESGPCYGYTDPCGQECFKHLSSRSALSSRAPSTLLRTTTGTWFASASPFSSNVVEEDAEDPDGVSAGPGAVSPGFRTTSRALSRDASRLHPEHEVHHNGDAHDHAHGGGHGHHHHEDDDADSHSFDSAAVDDLEAQHHHHVPTNAFLSIGLQTVIAIALHKFPEGFITYATNIASPALGFNVFMALFVHNIAEGFSMALPLYMAIGSKFKAIAWSSLLGGLSQPVGAAIAWLWFRLAHRSHMTINNLAYGALFAVTAGIMTSVALQLFVESLSLKHNRNLSIGFAFLGMLLLGFSSALVDDD